MKDDTVSWAAALNAAAFWGFVLACLVLTAGTPDLLDAIVQRVMECKP